MGEKDLGVKRTSGWKRPQGWDYGAWSATCSSLTWSGVWERKMEKNDNDSNSRPRTRSQMRRHSQMVDNMRPWSRNGPLPYLLPHWWGGMAWQCHSRGWGVRKASNASDKYRGAIDLPIPSQATQALVPWMTVAFSYNHWTGLVEWTGGQIFDMRLLLPPLPLTILKPRLCIGYCHFSLASNHSVLKRLHVLVLHNASCSPTQASESC